MVVETILHISPLLYHCYSLFAIYRVMYIHLAGTCCGTGLSLSSLSLRPIFISVYVIVTSMHYTQRRSRGLVQEARAYRLRRKAKHARPRDPRPAYIVYIHSLSHSTRGFGAARGEKIATNTTDTMIRRQFILQWYTYHHDAVHAPCTHASCIIAYLAILGSFLGRVRADGDTARIDYFEEARLHVGVRSRHHSCRIFSFAVGAVCWCLCESQPAQHASLQRSPARRCAVQRTNYIPRR